MFSDPAHHPENFLWNVPSGKFRAWLCSMTQLHLIDLYGTYLRRVVQNELKECETSSLCWIAHEIWLVLLGYTLTVKLKLGSDWDILWLRDSACVFRRHHSHGDIRRWKLGNSVTQKPCDWASKSHTCVVSLSLGPIQINKTVMVEHVFNLKFVIMSF